MRASSGCGQLARHLPPAGDVGDEAAEAAAGAGLELVAVEHRGGGEQQRLLSCARVRVDGGDRLVAEAALGLVDDPLEREVVGGLGDQAEVGEGVADLGALVEAEAADDLVGRPMAMNRSSNSRVWNWARTRMATSSSEPPRRCMRLDLLADAARFLRPVPDADDLDLLALSPVGPQRLAEAAGVVGDEAGRRRRGCAGSSGSSARAG